MGCTNFIFESVFLVHPTVHTNVSIWRNDNNQVDIGLPGMGGLIHILDHSLVLRLPFLLVLLTSDEDAGIQHKIHLYKLGTELDEGTLLKSVTFDLPLHFQPFAHPTINNQHLLAFRVIGDGCVYILRMDSLLDESKTAEEVEISRIFLPSTDPHIVCCMNTTTLLFNTPDNRRRVIKKDFWAGQDRPQSGLSLLSWLR